MTVYTCTHCGKRCLLVTDLEPYDDACPVEPERSADWQKVEAEFAEALLLGVAEQERRRLE